MAAIETITKDARPKQPVAPTLGDPVLDAAARLMSRPGGVEVTTLAEIAKEAGATPEDVLRRFPSLDHAAAAIFHKVFDHLPREIGEEIDAPLEDRLFAFLNNDFTMLEPYKPFVAAISIHAANPLSPSFVLLAQQAARYTAYVTEQIRAARSRHEVSRWIVPTVAAGAFWLVRMEAVRNWVQDDSRKSSASRRYANQLVRTFVTTLGGRPRRNAQA